MSSPNPPPLIPFSKNRETLKAAQLKMPSSRSKPKKTQLKKPPPIKTLLKLENLSKLVIL